MIERITRLRCDLCQRRGPTALDDLSACRKGQGNGWKFVQLHYCGIEAHFCPACCEGKTAQEVYDLMMEKENA